MWPFDRLLASLVVGLLHDGRMGTLRQIGQYLRQLVRFINIHTYLGKGQNNRLAC